MGLDGRRRLLRSTVFGIEEKLWFSLADGGEK
jgi:hypothetical protein